MALTIDNKPISDPDIEKFLQGIVKPGTKNLSTTEAYRALDANGDGQINLVDFQRITKQNPNLTKNSIFSANTFIKAVAYINEASGAAATLSSPTVLPSNNPPPFVFRIDGLKVSVTSNKETHAVVKIGSKSKVVNLKKGSNVIEIFKDREERPHFKGHLTITAENGREYLISPEVTVSGAIREEPEPIGPDELLPPTQEKRSEAVGEKPKPIGPNELLPPTQVKRSGAVREKPKPIGPDELLPPTQVKH